MKNPPKLARQLLSLFAGRADLEDIQGDMDEVYQHRVGKSSQWKTDLFYWRQVFSLLFSYGLKKRKKNSSYSSYYSLNSMAMVKNYFKIALRNFSKHKLFTSLNVFGLALGMSICLIALTMTVTIHQSDEFHVKKERIYEINTLVNDETSSYTYASTFHATGDFLSENYPFVEEVINIRSDFAPTVRHNGNDLDFRGYFADANFFEVFSFKLISGDPKTALVKPFSVVLTQKAATKLFRDQDPIGKTIETDRGTFNVTGVMEDLHQTYFFFEMLASYESFRALEDSDIDNDWTNFRNHYVYTLLREGTQPHQLQSALNETSARAAIFHPDNEIELAYTRLPNVVPRWNVRNALGVGWDQPSLVFFISIGILILLPAVFNHTNLSIARSLKRAKEIGIRKVVGAQKNQIKAQFIVETILLSILALLLSFVVMIPMKEAFLDMVYGAEVLDTDFNGLQAIVFFVFSLLVGLFAGIFPAKYFSKLSPIQTLKGEVMNGKNGVSGFKKGLFVFQFFMSLVFIIGVATISKQYRYVMNNNHGFESDNVLTIPFNGMDKRIAMSELGAHEDVRAITASSALPGLLYPNRVLATSNEIDSLEIMQVFISDHYTEQMKMELTWGESDGLATSNQTEELVLVNQQFIQALKVFNVQKDTLRFSLADGTRCRVAGILKDFNFEPLSELISPLVMRYSLEASDYALLTINSPDMKQTIDELERTWKGIDQDLPFEARFLDAEIEDAYFILMAQIKFFSVLSALAITIACLGLLGMVSYSTENKTKEIAVRKILGATNPSLYYLLTKDFVRLIGISSLLAIPFSYVFYDKFFLYFLIRYGTGLGVIEIIISMLFLFVIGALSIYWQTAKVTKASPATKLRYE